MDQIALDTTFLIDLQNERRGRGRARGASAFLLANRNAEFFLPVIARGEYLEGFERPEVPEAHEWIDAIKVLEVTAEVALSYASVARQLRAAGCLIGTNDLWIGCTALKANLPLATRNVTEFRRIPGLRVMEYGL
jgi:predicted nucleic acid-binding protein